MPATEQGAAGAATGNITIVRLVVNNHPGVMLQVCGLFARRAFNLEGVYCSAIGQGRTSRIWLKVNETTKLEQVIKQLAKLEDVLSVEQCDQVWDRLHELEGLMVALDG